MMDSNFHIIGLGRAGCNIAHCFEQYDQYNIIGIDTKNDLNIKNFVKIKKQKSIEEYEQNTPILKFVKKIKGKVLFIVGGSGTISGITLAILEQLKHCEISVLYIKPEIEFLNDIRLKQHNVVYGVLQEYARSTVLKEMIVVDNASIENIIGSLTISEFYKKINEYLVYTLHMINTFNNIDSIASFSSEIIETARISTIGVMEVESGQEKWFFSLDKEREKRYYYAIERSLIESDTKLFKKIKDQVKSKKIGNVKVSYDIYDTSYDKNYGFCVIRSSQIQK